MEESGVESCQLAATNQRMNVTAELTVHRIRASTERQHEHEVVQG